MTARLGKPFGYPTGQPQRPKVDPESKFLLAVFGVGVLIGACATILTVLTWLP